MFDDLPDQLEVVLDRSRAALSREIARARKTVDSLNAEKAAAAKALAELKDQCSQAKAELETTLAKSFSSAAARASASVFFFTKVSRAFRSRGRDTALPGPRNNRAA